MATWIIFCQSITNFSSKMQPNLFGMSFVDSSVLGMLDIGILNQFANKFYFSNLTPMA